MIPRMSIETASYYIAIVVIVVLVHTARATEHWTIVTPEERLNTVLLLRHGPIGPHLDRDTRQLVNSVLDDPDTYCPLLDPKLRAPNNSLELADYDLYSRLGSAVNLVGLLGQKCCSSSLERLFDELLQSYKQLRSIPIAQANDPNNTSISDLRAARSNCRLLLLITLRVLKDSDNPHALDSCMAIIESFQPSESGELYAMLEYLAKVAPQRPACRSELERMYSDLESRLFQQPRLRKVIDAIDTGVLSHQSHPHSDRTPNEGE